jgi:rhodanese-related sulfurtransferase
MIRAVAAAAVLFASALALPAAQQDPELESPALRVDWTEFKALYDRAAVVVVDVRDADAYEQGHIPGARSIPLSRIAGEASRLKKLARPLVTYCA